MSFKQFDPELKPKYSNFPKHNFKKKLTPEEEETYLPDFVNAHLLAQISRLSYKSSVKAESTDNSYKEAIRWTLMNSGLSSDDAKKTVFLNNSGTQGLIIFHQQENKKIAIIAFRGSEKKFNDWLYNANFKRIDFPYETGQAGNGDEKIHEGFLKAFQAILVNQTSEDGPKFDDYDTLKELDLCDSIWLTGHSLGGAIAIIAASYLLYLEKEYLLYLEKEKEKKVLEFEKKGLKFDNNLKFDDKIHGIYTYGAPRIGNDDYRQYINHVFHNKYWRFMHDHDIVPDLPPTYRFGGYSREGCMLRLKKRNNQSEYELLRIVNEKGDRERYGKRYDGFSASDHSMTEYINRLSELIEQQNRLSPKIRVSSLKEGKLLGENPEIFKLKKEILRYFQELIESKSEPKRTTVTLEEVAGRFQINEILLNWFKENP